MQTLYEIIAACFPLAARYRLRGHGSGLVREEAGALDSFPWTERHLQGVWADPLWRPHGLVTHRGEAVEVESAGVWNLEAGPDFLGAVLRIGKERRRIAGDIELHIHPSDWRQHGHASDPNYSRVIAHVSYFNAPLPDAELPAGCVQISLRDSLAANPLFAFENLDVTAYPYAARAEVPPCSVELAHFSPEQKTALLDSAGEERLRRKAERLAASIAERGAEQVLYEEVFSALGYKNNKSPFRRLAEIVSLADLRAASGGNPRAAYALLAGVSGLLPASLRSEWDEETRSFVREVWDAWWKVNEVWEGRALRRDAWKLSGLRPMNHPLRRLMAAAQMFVGASPLAWLDGGPEDFVERVQRVQDAYWSFREGFAGKKSAKPIQLVGAERADALSINVVTPFLAAMGKQKLFEGGLLNRLPVEGDNAILRHTARYLFGPNHPTKLYDTGRRRQGLLQVFHDYCLNDRSRCASCPFPEMLRGFQRLENNAT